MILKSFVKSSEYYSLLWTKIKLQEIIYYYLKPLLISSADAHLLLA